MQRNASGTAGNSSPGVLETRKRTYNACEETEMEDTPERHAKRSKKGESRVQRARLLSFDPSEKYLRELQTLLGGSNPHIEIKSDEAKFSQSDVAHDKMLRADRIDVAEVAPAGSVSSPGWRARVVKLILNEIEVVDLTSDSDKGDKNGNKENMIKETCAVDWTADQILEDLKDPEKGCRSAELEKELYAQFPDATIEALTKRAYNQAKTGTVDPELMEFLNKTPIQSECEEDDEDDEDDEDEEENDENLCIVHPVARYSRAIVC